VDRVVAPWDYGGAARKLILDLKLRGLAAAADPLVAGMTDHLLRRGSAADWITWVPCRSGDRRRRGFDHAEVLARGVALRLGLPRRPALRRVGSSVDQAGLSASERARNLRGTFRATPVGGSVLLVDDLVTTGATASACARALRSAGASGVEVMVACRA
jgi:predicted amidophosphoribosyltransferase